MVLYMPNEESACPHSINCETSDAFSNLPDLSEGRSSEGPIGTLLLRETSDVTEAEIVFAQRYNSPSAKPQGASSCVLHRVSPGYAPDHAVMRRRARLLANIYNWLTVGFDTRHLKEAKALLNELASQAVVEESRK